MAELKNVEFSVQHPLNREPPAETLISSFITPSDLAYDRNHGPIPYLSASSHYVHIDGDGVRNPISLSIQELQTYFEQHEVICALQCAGNRRHTMRTLLKEVQGIDWKDAAVMNCQWKGPRLCDVLHRARVVVREREKYHVAFACEQVPCQDDEWYGGSVKLIRCLDSDVILALEMNHHPLPINKGYPVRVVIPGVVGARWVKWLDRITVQKEESPNFYQQRDYKILPPEATDAAKAAEFWDKTPAMMETLINSIVAVPQDGQTIHLDEDGLVEVKGYAVPQGYCGPIVRVEVSGDGGRTWTDAWLENRRASKWAWVLWTARVPMSRGTQKQIFSRATDYGGNTQPETSQWNLRGVGYNGYGLAKNLTII